MSHDRAIRNLAEDVVNAYYDQDDSRAREAAKLRKLRVTTLADSLQQTIESYVEDIEQEDRASESSRQDRASALAEADRLHREGGFIVKRGRVIVGARARREERKEGVA